MHYIFFNLMKCCRAREEACRRTIHKLLQTIYKMNVAKGVSRDVQCLRNGNPCLRWQRGKGKIWIKHQGKNNDVDLRSFARPSSFIFHSLFVFVSPVMSVWEHVHLCGVHLTFWGWPRRRRGAQSVCISLLRLRLRRHRRRRKLESRTRRKKTFRSTCWIWRDPRRLFFTPYFSVVSVCGVMAMDKHVNVCNVYFFVYIESFFSFHTLIRYSRTSVEVCSRTISKKMLMIQERSVAKRALRGAQCLCIPAPLVFATT